MTDTIKKLPPWLLDAVKYIVFLAFAAGGAYATFAPKEWVTEKIDGAVKVHEERTESQRKEDMRDIKDALRRIEERVDKQYDRQRR